MKILKIIIGLIRLLFGFCPKCNSDAPKLYDCNVCFYNKVKSRKELYHNFFKQINENT